jgi:prepilin-type processing-associated H-X9-DG protein
VDRNQVNLEDLKGADYWTVRRVIQYLQNEPGAVSASVALQGKALVVFADGHVEEAA